MNLITFIVILMRFLQTIAYIGLFHFSLLKIKEQKKERITITVVIYLVTVALYCVVLVLFGQRIVELLIMPVEIWLCVILIYICSADRWPISLFVMFTQFNVLLGISYISDICSSGHSPLLYQIEYFLIRTVLFGGALIFSFKYLRPHFRKLVETLGNGWDVLYIAAFSFYLLEAVIQYYPRMYWYETDFRWYLVASSYVVFLSVYWLIFRSVTALVGKFEMQEREHVLAQQNKMWEEQIEEQKMAINAARRDRHDLRHHYDTLLTMLEGGKTIEAVSYLNMQTQRNEGIALGGVCEHLAANAILSRWEARAREKGIRTELDVRIPASLPMDGVALVGILANSFENALEGCMRCPEGTERIIKTKIAYSTQNGAEKLYMVMENSCAENLIFEKGIPKTQKAGGGTGTKSILYTAGRYNGMVDFSVEDGVFRTRVILHFQKAPI